MKKVNWGARNDYEFVKNYKVLQSVFNKHKIQKHVDVEKLVRGKYQDNLEWMQWLKSFYESNMGEDEAKDYDPVSRRSRSKGAPKATARRAPAAAEKENRKRTVAAKKSSTAATTNRKATASAASSTRRKPAAASSGASVAHVKKLTSENAELKLMVEGLEKERDFYFNKLRDVEVLLQNEKLSGETDEGNISAKDLAKKVLAVLYATDEEAGVGEESANASAPAEAAKTSAPAAVAEKDMLF